MTFVDSGAWFALYITVDQYHEAAVRWMASNRDTLLTTDYIIDETLSLMRARRQRDIAIDFGTDVFAGLLADVHLLSTTDIADAWDVFCRFDDKDWSFTDCTSKVVMESLGIDTAFSFDRHFHQFGTVTVVP